MMPMAAGLLPAFCDRAALTPPLAARRSVRKGAPLAVGLRPTGPRKSRDRLASSTGALHRVEVLPANRVTGHEVVCGRAQHSPAFGVGVREPAKVFGNGR
jgi:hypothetical protein